MQHRITAKGPLLDEQGVLVTPGYATQLFLDYDRQKIKANKFRIKEWDYYIVLNEDYGVAFTVADNGYLGFVSVTFFDFIRKVYTTKSKMKWFPLGSFNMPKSSKQGSVMYHDKQIKLEYKHQGNFRHISCTIDDFEGSLFEAKLKLEKVKQDSMVIATPFLENKKAFYYNHKINCMPATGTVLFRGETITFEDHAFGTLDWGRGVWTYDNTWYWGSASGVVNDKPFGFNVGYGFGDTSKATENMLFYDGVAHKLEEVRFQIPLRNNKDDFLSVWTFTSNNGRFELTFTPILDRVDKINVLFLVSDQHQTFGYFDGTVTLDDGTILEINHLLGFAEKVRNKW